LRLAERLGKLWRLSGALVSSYRVWVSIRLRENVHLLDIFPGE
jgi:hypothetical protein